jgi:hypothetical protein
VVPGAHRGRAEMADHLSVCQRLTNKPSLEVLHDVFLANLFSVIPPVGHQARKFWSVL